MWSVTAMFPRWVRTNSEMDRCSPRRRAWVLDRREGTVREGDAASGVVHANVQFATARAAHDVGLDLLVVVSAFRGDFTEGNDELKEVADLDRAVYLRELREKAGKDGMLEKGDVRRTRRVGSERFENRGNGGRQGERIEGDLEHIVQRLDDRRGKLEGIV